MIISRPLLLQIITYYGRTAQLHMCIEEMSELTKVICKIERGKFSLEDLKEELADVLIMIEQLKIMYRISETDIQEIVDSKLQRQLRRMYQDEES